MDIYKDDQKVQDDLVCNDDPQDTISTQKLPYNIIAKRLETAKNAIQGLNAKLKEKQNGINHIWIYLLSDKNWFINNL